MKQIARAAFAFLAIFGIAFVASATTLVHMDLDKLTAAATAIRGRSHA